MAYKHTIKVSNVCQLLDKSKYPATTTNKGITITNNGDGSITLNGTATSDGELYSLQYINLINGHKYFIYDNQGGSFGDVVFTLDALGSAGNREGNIETCNITSGPLRRNAYFYVVSGTVINNRIYKPQLFDLTEMFGSGHEPTTVAEFRQKFPDELYPYSPLTNLQSNKRMIKVSNVCQLYAKNIWKEYTDLYGVSIKNNNDGSITLNGTATETFFYTNRLDYEIKPNHKYLYFDHYPQTPSWESYIGGCEGKVNHESEAKFAVYSLNKDGTIDSSSPNLPSNTLLNTFCMVYKGFTLNNITIKPQLFDLTEMYGAGHEPETVAEFRQKFPDELYPYSPQCWLTSYQSAVICKTKNLFDYKTSAEKTQTNNGITLTLNADYFELSGQQQTGKYIELGQSGFNIPFEIGKTYVLSADTIVKSGGKVFMRARYTDGESPLTEWETVSWNLFNGTIAKRFTPTRPGYFDKITFYNAGDTILISGDYIVRIQLEQGSTATSYVPYQHL